MQVYASGIYAASADTRFPVVCIGASAGGLEALEQFLGNIPANTGIAYVVIQHLDPNQKGMLPELLQRVTHMQVLQVKSRMILKPDSVYVIPPNAHMSVKKYTLYLAKPSENNGPRMPVDLFVRSLADDLQEKGVAVILSGMGYDGSAGIRALKEKNGLVLVQDPGEARFDSMPRSAIESVRVDAIAPARELPARLITLLHPAPVKIETPDNEINDHSSLEKIISILQSHTGTDFSLYKKNTLYRRIERRMGVHKIDTIFEYVSFLLDNPKESEILYKELLIGVTRFFRDNAVWAKLEETLIPMMIYSQLGNTLLRAWVPACSTGEEAYSLAIIFREVLDKISPPWAISLQIFATDLDIDAIETARKGVFPRTIASDVSHRRLSRFFTQTEEGFRINNEIREMIVFARQNIISDPPFTKIDLLTCRNLLIYMDQELQKKLLALFHFSINPDGFLVLGSAESPGVQNTHFVSLDNKLKIFQHKSEDENPELPDFKPVVPHKKTESVPALQPRLNLHIFADQILLEQFSPPGVLVNEKGDIIYISGRTCRFLEPAVGKTNMNIFAMLREELRADFPAAFRQAVSGKEQVVLSNLKSGTGLKARCINIILQWVDQPQPLHGMIMIVFKDATRIHTGNNTENNESNENVARVMGLEKKLRRLKSEMQARSEEMQTGQEELKATIEELQSANEELQSTNEQLTTSVEEMQSLNEEMQTVNAELKSKLEDYLRTNIDLKNLLEYMDLAILFLDKELNIRRYTQRAVKLFGLVKSDIGRPFTEQITEFQYPGLADDAHEVIQTQGNMHKQIATIDGRWFSICIMPNRTFDDKIEGIIITFSNISEYKELESELMVTRRIKEVISDWAPFTVVRLDKDWKILDFNIQAERFFGKKKGDVLNRNFFVQFTPAPVQQKYARMFHEITRRGEDTQLRIKVVLFQEVEQIVEWKVKILPDLQGKPTGVILLV